MSAVLEIVFSDVTKLKAFMDWFNNSGEQYYFEDENDCDAVCEFDYDYNHRRIITKDYICEETMV
jgi:DNA-binding MltR family transcriptional regulator